MFLTRFTDYEKGIIRARIEDKWGARRIARIYGWKKSSVQYYISAFKQTGTMRSKARNSGRKRKTGARTDRRITRAVLWSPEKRRKGSKRICKELTLNVTLRTVRNRLKESGLNSYSGAKKPYLRSVYIKKTSGVGKSACLLDQRTMGISFMEWWSSIYGFQRKARGNCKAKKRRASSPRLCSTNAKISGWKNYGLGVFRC